MISNLNKNRTIVLMAVLIGVTAFIVLDPAPKKRPQAFEDVTGTLYSASIPTLAKADAPLPAPQAYLPHVSVFVDDLALLGVPPDSTSFIVDVSKDAKARYKLFTREDGIPAKPGDATHAHVAKRVKALVANPVANSVAVAVTTPVTSPASPQSARDTFLTLSNRLSENPISFPVDMNVKKGGISVGLEQLGKFEGYYLLRFSVANNEPEEFFISRVYISLRGVPVASKEYMAYSCRPREVVYGLIKFPISDVAGEDWLYVDGKRWRGEEI